MPAARIWSHQLVDGMTTEIFPLARGCGIIALTFGIAVLILCSFSSGISSLAPSLAIHDFSPSWISHVLSFLGAPAPILCVWFVPPPSHYCVVSCGLVGFDASETRRE